jgi:hypothetical protein
VRGLAHQWMNHQVWRVGFDYLCCLRFADYMALEFNGLVEVDSGKREKGGRRRHHVTS